MNTFFNKEYFVKQFTNLFPEKSKEEIDAYAEFMAKKYSTVIYGKDVIHMEYYGSLITKEEISSIANGFYKNKIKFSSFDKDGVPYNSLEQFLLQVSLELGNDVVKDIIVGVAGGMIWDVVKSTALNIWKIVNDRKEPEETLNVGLKISIDEYNKFDFMLDGKFSEKITQESLDQILKFLNNKKLERKNKRPDFLVFDKKLKKWLKVDVDEEIKKMIKSQQNISIRKFKKLKQKK